MSRIHSFRRKTLENRVFSLLLISCQLPTINIFLILFFFEYFQIAFLCFECGKRFKCSSSLHTHRISHNEKTMKCPDCPMTFNRIAGLRKHRDIHLNLKYKCNLCHAELKSKDGLERHTSLITSHLFLQAKSSVLVEFIMNLFFWRIFLGKHRLTENDKRHKCTFCPMKFFKKDKLTRHIRTHTGEKRMLKDVF